MTRDTRSVVRLVRLEKVGVLLGYFIDDSNRGKISSPLVSSRSDSVNSAALKTTDCSFGDREEMISSETEEERTKRHCTLIYLGFRVKKLSRRRVGLYVQMSK